MEKRDKRILERRRYIRLPFETDIKYKIEDEENAKLETAKSENISAEGLCLILDKPIKKGAILSIEVTIKELPSCHVKGEVMWVTSTDKKDEKVRVGVKVLDLENTDKARFLLELCDKMVNELGQKYPNIKL